jgi:hypothetical protein
MPSAHAKYELLPHYFVVIFLISKATALISTYGNDAVMSSAVQECTWQKGNN